MDSIVFKRINNILNKSLQEGISETLQNEIQCIVHVLQEKYNEIYICLESLKKEQCCNKFNLSSEKLPQSGGHHPENIKITLIQNSSIHERELEEFIIHERELNIQKTDIFLFYEYWFNTITNKDIKDIPACKKYLEIAKKYEIYICLGAGVELDKISGLQYCTSIFIGPDGFIGKYRKQRPIMQSFSKGKAPGVWDTPLGRIAILICFDIENADVFNETMNLSPDILLNPVLISKVGRQDSELCHSQWNIGMDEMSQKFEALSRLHSCAFVRCDAPHGLGSSQVISPVETLTGPTNEKTIFSVHIPKTRPTIQTKQNIYNITNQGYGFEEICNPPERPRTELRDNTGSRILAKTKYASHNPIASGILIDQGNLLVTTEKFHSKASKIEIYQTPTITKKANFIVDLNLTSISSISNNDKNFIGIGKNQANVINLDNGEVVTKWDFSSDISSNLNSFNGQNLYFGCENDIFCYDFNSNSHSFNLKFDNASFLSQPINNSNYLFAGNSNGVVSLFDIRNTNTCLFSSKTDDKMIGLQCNGNDLFLIYENGLLQRNSIDDFSSKEFSPITCKLSTENVNLTTSSILHSESFEDSWLLLGYENGQIQFVPTSFSENQSNLVLYKLMGHTKQVSYLHTDGNKIFSSTGDHFCVWHYRQNRHFKPWATAFRTNMQF